LPDAGVAIGSRSRKVFANARERAVARQEALIEGRELARDRHWQLAADRLRDAVEAAPEDAGVRCELAWAALHAGDLDLATRELDWAIAQLEARHLRRPPSEERARVTFAQCLYNRGRVAEARGDLVTARGYYTRSLDLRENGAVRRRLAELGPAATPRHSESW
jgi:tetratricopeptide (TPR) repeat protein